MKSSISINKKISLGLIILSCFLFVAKTRAGVIFETNFDSNSDWQTNTTMRAACQPSGCTSGAVASPSNWDWYTTQESWNPISSSPTIGSQPSMQINNSQHYGSFGKAFVEWKESTNNQWDGDGWGSDGILAKNLGQDYKEIYAQYKIKFQPNWQWFWTIGGNAGFAKLFRIYHFDNTGSPFQYFNAGPNAPTYLFDAVQNEYGNQFSISPRCDPQETDYFCPGISSPYQKFLGSPSWISSLGDGNWHSLQLRVKMNSDIGIADGILAVYLDGVLQYQRADIDWIRAGGNPDVGWNIIGIGGNSFNNYKHIMGPYPWSADAEQWYAIDDVVVSTSYIPNDYVIGGTKKYFFSDFSSLFSNWHNAGSGINSDINSDNTVNAKDLGIMMSKWN